MGNPLSCVAPPCQPLELRLRTGTWKCGARVQRGEEEMADRTGTLGTQTKGLSPGGTSSHRPFLVCRTAGSPQAHLNACPHTWMPYLSRRCSHRAHHTNANTPPSQAAPSVAYHNLKSSHSLGCYLSPPYPGPGLPRAGALLHLSARTWLVPKASRSGLISHPSTPYGQRGPSDP